jgi:hypothetical protein
MIHFSSARDPFTAATALPFMGAETRFLDVGRQMRRQRHAKRCSIIYRFWHPFMVVLIHGCCEQALETAAAREEALEQERERGDMLQARVRELEKVGVGVKERIDKGRGGEGGRVKAGRQVEGKGRGSKRGEGGEGEGVHADQCVDDSESEEGEEEYFI